MDREAYSRVSNGQAQPGDETITLPEISTGVPGTLACITIRGMFPHPDAEEQTLNPPAPPQYMPGFRQPEQ